MPVMLDNLAANNAATCKTYSPKFFSDVLTGRGKTTGVLNQTVNPSYIPKDKQIAVNNDLLQPRKRTFSSGDTHTTCIPVNPVSYEVWSYMKEIPFSKNNLLHLGSHNNCELYACLDVHSVMYSETNTSQSDNTKSTKKKFTACYQLRLYSIKDTAATTVKIVDENAIWNNLSNPVDNVYTNLYTCNPTATFSEIIEIASNTIGMTIQPQPVADYINDYCLYDAICMKSQQWQTEIDAILDNVFENISTIAYSSSNANMYLNALSRQIRFIEDYNVPLDLYRNIYASLNKYFKKDDMTILCKQNLNLLLSNTLNNLNVNKAQLQTMPVNPNNPVDISYYSVEQKKAITSTDPLILVQAGAGTGKSTVILGRINYMIGAGVDPHDITVLSFTNAAADNITAKNPNINSMTIARMIHNIYSENFDNHELSSIDTLINSLEIYFPGNNEAMAFRNKLINIQKNRSDAFTQMNAFVEKYYDEVINMLDTIRQTCLEMEIIICYQKIDVFKEPDCVKSKYLIIDEVQDNSIFEFIYTIRYVDKHKESMFIVGDCSQTLYEFRASNPKALNVLEGSGIFTSYQLQVNYRSTQEILDFANVALKNIEANQYANIQLQANNLTPVTEKSFTDAVHFHYECIKKISDFNLSLSNIIEMRVKDYIDEKLKNNEQITFLAYTRKHVAMIEGILKDLYPDKTIANLVPAKLYNSVIFSHFISAFWNEIKFAPSVNIVNVISTAIYNKIDYLVHGNPTKAMPAIQKLIGSWVAEQGSTITEWQRQVSMGLMTLDDFMENIKHNMLSYEIRHNAVKQALLSSQNEQNKQNNQVQNANFVLSTIHSAKGLEFDNVVVIYRNKNDLEEDAKRMYYVAFTRAMKSEFILAYDTVKKPKIEADYWTIVRDLHAKAPDPNSMLNTSDDDNDD